MGKTPYQKTVAKQQKAANKDGNSKKRLLKFIASVLIIALTVGAVSGIAYALTTKNEITGTGYLNYLTQVAQVEKTVQERNELRTELTEEQAMVSTLTNEKTALEIAVAQKDAAIATKTAEIEAHLQTIATLQAQTTLDAAQLAENAALIADLQGQIAGKNASIGALVLERDALQTELEEKNMQLFFKNQTIADLEAQITAKDVQISELIVQVQTLESTVIQKDNTISYYFNEILRLEQELNSVKTEEKTWTFVVIENNEIVFNQNYSEGSVSIDLNKEGYELTGFLWFDEVYGNYFYPASAINNGVLEVSNLIDYPFFFNIITPIYELEQTQQQTVILSSTSAGEFYQSSAQNFDLTFEFIVNINQTTGNTDLLANYITNGVSTQFFGSGFYYNPEYETLVNALNNAFAQAWSFTDGLIFANIDGQTIQVNLFSTVQSTFNEMLSNYIQMQTITFNISNELQMPANLTLNIV